jgi:hypothetical protein
MMGAIYCTSFCNHGHDLETGRPVGHECYILNPRALKAERDGDVEKSQKLWTEGRIVRGCARKEG